MDATYKAIPIADMPLPHIAKLPDAELAQLDAAALHLRVAAGLPGTEGFEIPPLQSLLDRIATLVGVCTRERLDEYERQPAAYEHSAGIFRMAVMADVLQRRVGMRYNPALICEPDPSHRWDLHGFEDSRNLFIHGVVSGHGGTCTSMPLMYLAVGRRLGYPLRLVLAKAHLFVRWEETGGERFNIEATTTRGLNTFSDDYYRKWPLEITEDESAAGYYLASLSPREEFGLFLSLRAQCLFANGRATDAAKCYAAAGILHPCNIDYRRSFLFCMKVHRDGGRSYRPAAGESGRVATTPSRHAAFEGFIVTAFPSKGRKPCLANSKVTACTASPNG